MSLAVTSWSSGDSALDRRYAYALQAFNDKAYADVLDIIRDPPADPALWAPWWILLGETYAALCNIDVACAAFEQALQADAHDKMGAQLRLNELQGARNTQLQPAYVAALFDAYAPNFEQHLQSALRYNAPALVAYHLRDYAAQYGMDLPADNLMDLGCGTGLSGTALKPLAQHMDGCDLSRAMLAKAAEKNIYAQLYADDFIKALAQSAKTYDMIVAIDAFVYCGALEPVLSACYASLRKNGLVTFTVEQNALDGYLLAPERRFKHHKTYVSDALFNAGFVDVTMVPIISRQNAGADVQGLCVLARKF